MKPCLWEKESNLFSSPSLGYWRERIRYQTAECLNEMHNVGIVMWTFSHDIVFDNDGPWMYWCALCQCTVAPATLCSVWRRRALAPAWHNDTHTAELFMNPSLFWKARSLICTGWIAKRERKISHYLFRIFGSKLSFGWSNHRIFNRKARDVEQYGKAHGFQNQIRLKVLQWLACDKYCEENVNKFSY